MRTAYCVNLGCSENAPDGALISSYLHSNDWRLVEQPELAHPIIVNSCGFNQGAEQNSIRTYRDLRARKRAYARIVSRDACHECHGPDGFDEIDCYNEAATGCYV
jgi:tRNA A37 methylthiotransferase MiaB